MTCNSVLNGHNAFKVTLIILFYRQTMNKENSGEVHTMQFHPTQRKKLYFYILFYFIIHRNL